MKSLRMNKRWSQEQLAQLSGLNVRTIQRAEKGQSVGMETLKSLAAVFEISTDELQLTIESQQQPIQSKDDETFNEQQMKNDAQKKVKSIKYFYGFSAYLIVVFLLFLLPNYNDGENLGPLVVAFICFAALIAIHAYFVFQPFDKKWEDDKVSTMLSQQSAQSNSATKKSGDVTQST